MPQSIEPPTTLGASGIAEYELEEVSDEKELFFCFGLFVQRMPKRSGIYCRCCGPGTKWGPRHPFRVNSSRHSYRSRTPVGSRVKEAPPRTLGTIRNNLSKSTALPKVSSSRKGACLGRFFLTVEGKLPEIAGYTRRVGESPQLLVDWQGFCKMLPRYWSFLGIGTSSTATCRPLGSRRLPRSIGVLKELELHLSPCSMNSGRVTSIARTPGSSDGSSREAKSKTADISTTNHP
jgi:hypothetical protein